MTDDRPTVTVLGGYGSIGRLVAEHLARSGTCRLIVAGRDTDRAEATARTLGADATGLALDAEHARPAPLGRVVVNATGPSWRTSLPAARLALASGADIVDLGGYDLLHDGIAGSLTPDARIVVSAGWMPGLSEVLCRRVVEDGLARLGGIDRVDVLCGARDRWSASSAGDMVWHLLERPGSGWYRDGAWEAVAPWRALRRATLPAVGRQWLAAVPNPQLAAVAAELRPARIATWLGLIGRRTLAAIIRARALGRRDPEGAAAGLARAIAAEAGSDPIGICEVRVAGPGGRRTGRILTRDNLRVTAIAGAEAALALLDAARRPPAGIHYLGDAVAPAAFLARMTAAGVDHALEAA